MSTTYKGSCSCSAIKIEVKGAPMFVGLCHCHNCQKSTSSTYSTNWVVSRANFALVSGDITTYVVNDTTGALRQFCGKCSCTMWTETSKMLDIVVVKAGVMDDHEAFSRFKPESESFTSRKPAWVGCVAGAVQFEEAFQAKKA